MTGDHVNAYRDFGPFDGKIWLNVASEGPLPHAAMDALKDAVEWKLQPFQLTVSKFLGIPQQLRLALGSLIHVDPNDIILGNSATYGISLLANGLPLAQGDEVLLMQNDFPSNLLPWMALRKKGVVVKELKSQGHVLTLDEIAAAVSPSTKVLCLSWVHTFSGHKIDPVKIGNFCREKGIVFILNCSQAIGAFSVDLAGMPVDAIVSAGYKWLCGPYGTGFCWIKPDVREKLQHNSAYWQSVLDEQQLNSTDPIGSFELKAARHYDMFGTANFFNYAPWTAAINYLSKLGMDKVTQYNQQLVGMILDGIDKNQFTLISPTEPGERSNLVVFSHKDPQNNAAILNKLKDVGIFLALWKGKLRASPHIHNTRNDIDRFTKVLNSCMNPQNERSNSNNQNERTNNNQSERTTNNNNQNERSQTNTPKTDASRADAPRADSPTTDVQDNDVAQIDDLQADE